MHNLSGYIHLWKPLIEVLILWFVIYRAILFFVGTRAITVIRGIVVLLVGFFLFERLNFRVLEWLLTKLFGISVIAILVIFHTEIRQGLARLGQRRFFAVALREEEWNRILRQVADAAENLIRNKIGGLMVIEKNNPLTPYIESGIQVDAQVSSELIQAVFTPNNPLHDGGLIIRNGRLAAAGCIFPLTDKQDLDRVFGMRHRAALGLSEEADAVIIVVSEERGDMSLVYRGKLYKDMGGEEIFNRVKEIIKSDKEDV